MRITFIPRKFGNVERNSHCDVLHITPVRVARLVLDCNGVFAIKAYGTFKDESIISLHTALPISNVVDSVNAQAEEVALRA